MIQKINENVKENLCVQVLFDYMYIIYYLKYCIVIFSLIIHILLK